MWYVCMFSFFSPSTQPKCIEVMTGKHFWPSQTHTMAKLIEIGQLHIWPNGNHWNEINDWAQIIDEATFIEPFLCPQTVESSVEHTSSLQQRSDHLSCFSFSFVFIFFAFSFQPSRVAQFFSQQLRCLKERKYLNRCSFNGVKCSYFFLVSVSFSLLRAAIDRKRLQAREKVKMNCLPVDRNASGFI